MPHSGAEPAQLIEHVFRRHYGRMVAGLTRVFGPGQLDLVEDVVQEALLRAVKLWPFQGVPDDPAAWLVRVARHLALDATRRRATARREEERLRHWAEHAAEAAARPAPAPDEVRDDQLRMIFTCCHPALSPESRVALTLKTLCGFGVGEIASALLSKETTIAQRLTRAKAQLQRGVDFAVPRNEELGARLDGVLEVLYLLFNEGYRAHRGEDLVRPDLIGEAIRLAQLLLEMQQTAQPAVHALLALMLLHAARLPARVGAGGELLTLALQDRSRWDRALLRRGFAHFARSIGGPELTPLHVQAAIASAHASAPTYAATDWPTILRYYDQLLALQDSGLVRLNRAVAVAKVHGPRAALAEVEGLAADPALRDYMLLPATRAQLLWAAGEHTAAAASLRDALQRECSAPERALLLRRLLACDAGEAAPEF
jgi:RNA polymerase sigma-70 factor (ECF subfamily)